MYNWTRYLGNLQVSVLLLLRENGGTFPVDIKYTLSYYPDGNWR
jgi:hypothetical protein